ncbi:MAG: YvcK family protein, partial [Candidatus Obscuribacterales bacterium]|nr:YvcK family protein [Candidatus Obscuribacterales bacterium]
MLLRRAQSETGPRIVVIGGGTGLANLLTGLKAYTNNLTAIVTVGDDGGSSGRLREELGVLPPGDIRNCITALADEEKLVTELFRYRFAS